MNPRKGKNNFMYIESDNSKDFVESINDFMAEISERGNVKITHVNHTVTKIDNDLLYTALYTLRDNEDDIKKTANEVAASLKQSTENTVRDQKSDNIKTRLDKLEERLNEV